MTRSFCLALVVAASCSASATPSSGPKSAPAPRLDETWNVQSLGVPVRSARVWTTALAPNARGGWNFIAQSYELHSTKPPEFVVVDLETGSQRTFPGPDGLYANQLFQTSNQLRAPNGRIFFPLAETNLAYYDPADEQVKQLGRVTPSKDDKIIYSAVFGPDGMLYGGTQSSGTPSIVQIDPNTLKTKVLGSVGKDRASYSYAYELLVDPPWVYAVVGESPWQLAALDTRTGKSRVLRTATTSDAAIKLQPTPTGAMAEIIENLRSGPQHRERLACIDGNTVPITRVPRLKARVVAPLTTPLQDAPEIVLDHLNPDSANVGRVMWRKHHIKDSLAQTRFAVKNAEPVNIESLVALPDGGVLGNTEQYHGFFKYDPSTKRTVAFVPHGPSRGPRTVVNGHVYIAGYPKGVLYDYDPSKTWTSTLASSSAPTQLPGTNPRRLGNFAASGTHYAYDLIASSNGRLYYAGRRERDGVGTGVGSYDLSTGTFAGHHKNLEMLDPQGLAVLDDVDRVVLSGSGATNEAAGKLVLFDRELREVDRVEVKPGLHSPGKLFSSHRSGVVVGLVPEEKAIYRYDVRGRKLLSWHELGGAIGASTQHPADLSVWVIVDGALQRIDPDTLEMTSATMRGLPINISLLAWQGLDLYLAAKSELFLATPASH